MANEYATVSELKATLELSGETFADADLTLALTAASRAVDLITDRRFWVDSDANQVRYYSPTDPCRLSVHDVVAITEVATDEGGDGTFERTWTVNSDFLAEPLNAAADGWPWTTLVAHPRSALYFPIVYPRSVRLTGKFGWSAVPEGVKQATKIVAAKLAKRAREAPFGVVSFGAEGGVRIARNDPDVIGLLEPFQRWTM